MSKHFRYRRILVVINAALCKNISNLLPDTPFACAYGANSLKQLEIKEIVAREEKLRAEIDKIIAEIEESV